MFRLRWYFGIRSKQVISQKNWDIFQHLEPIVIAAAKKNATPTPYVNFEKLPPGGALSAHEFLKAMTQLQQLRARRQILYTKSIKTSWKIVMTENRIQLKQKI